MIRVTVASNAVHLEAARRLRRGLEIAGALETIVEAGRFDPRTIVFIGSSSRGRALILGLRPRPAPWPKVTDGPVAGLGKVGCAPP